MSKVKRKHIEQEEYLWKMIEYESGELSDKEIKELEEDIKTWELFRISKLVGMGFSDIDGIPTPLLEKKMKDFQSVDWNGGDDNNKYISCFNVIQFTEEEDEKPLHSSQGTEHKNIGEQYRTIQHQLMMYQIHYRDRGKKK